VSKKDKINLIDPDLFGNDLAEDEDEDIFSSYAYENPELERLLNNELGIQIVRAYKGEGKSALLRLAKSKLELRKNVLLLELKGSNIAPTLSDFDPHIWIRNWKIKIMEQVAIEVGSKIKMAWSDDAIHLVNDSEKTGFKRRNIFSAVFDRIKVTSLPVDKKDLSLANAEKIIQRYIKNKTSIWIIIDDLDLNFKNDPMYRNKLGNFFSACRELSQSNSGLKFRVSIRPNVWSVLKQEFEALSHVEQYSFDLVWPERLMRKLLALRVVGYCNRHKIAITEDSDANGEEQDNKVISMIFGEGYQWKDKVKVPSAVIATLSNYRPRWMVMLCRAAAAEAKKKNKQKIDISDFVEILGDFGEKRLNEMIAEFRPQCSDIGVLVNIFDGGREEYSHAEVLEKIKISTKNAKYMVGSSASATPDDILSLLHQAGLFFARIDKGDGHYDHVKFHELPSISRSIDPNMAVIWEMHPVYRQALHVRDRHGKIHKTESFYR
jgi:hypothetical protein